jgi:hypothetical protein
MKPQPAQHTCPVCGYPGLGEAPRAKSGGGSYEICPCCGYQFGVDDDDRRISHAAHRNAWVKGGLNWWSKASRPPPGWDAKAQLAALNSGTRKLA